MFKVIAEPQFTHTVAVMVPVDGGHEEQSVDARYRVVDSDRLDEININTSEGMIAFVRTVLVSLDDLVDPSGKEMPYNDALRDQLLRLPYMRIALVNGYFNGVLKAKGKN